MNNILTKIIFDIPKTIWFHEIQKYIKQAGIGRVVLQYRRKFRDRIAKIKFEGRENSFFDFFP